MSVPRTVMLPLVTTINSVPITSVLPLPETQIANMFADSSGNVNLVPVFGQYPYVIPCSTIASAFNFIQQIQNFLNSTGARVFTPVIT